MLFARAINVLHPDTLLWKVMVKGIHPLKAVTMLHYAVLSFLLIFMNWKNQICCVIELVNDK